MFPQVLYRVQVETNAKVLKQLNFYGKLPRFSVRVIANHINRQLNRLVKHMVRLEQVVLCKISVNCLPPTVFITVLLCRLRSKPRGTIRNQNYFSQKKRGHTSSSVWLRKTSPELQQEQPNSPYNRLPGQTKNLLS